MADLDTHSLARLRLALIPGLGPITQRELVKRFQTAAGVFAATREEVEDFAGPAVATALSATPARPHLDRALAWLDRDRAGHHLVCMEDALYPARLREIESAPGVLFAIGRLDLLEHPCLAIVGSRNATPQGERDARALAHALSDAGLCIASGLALGIDAAAHRGGLDGRASSIAVMGTGPDIFYPRRNRDLAARLAEQGCVLTEFAPTVPPDSRNFPRRNRLISGLALGVLVVEANAKSGSLGTARIAAEQGREVFALPGSVHSPLSKGCHKLIKEGATLVEGAEDILLELGFASRRSTPCAPVPSDASPSDPVLDALAFDTLSVDEIARRSGLEVGPVAAHLSQLEIAGAVEAAGSGRFQRVERSPQRA